MKTKCETYGEMVKTFEGGIEFQTAVFAIITASRAKEAAEAQLMKVMRESKVFECEGCGPVAYSEMEAIWAMSKNRGAYVVPAPTGSCGMVCKCGRNHAFEFAPEEIPHVQKLMKSNWYL